MGFSQWSWTSSMSFISFSLSLDFFVIQYLIRILSMIQSDYLMVHFPIVILRQRLLGKIMGIRPNQILRSVHLHDPFHWQAINWLAGEQPTKIVHWKNMVNTLVDKNLCTRNSNGQSKVLIKSKTIETFLIPIDYITEINDTDRDMKHNKKKKKIQFFFLFSSFPIHRVVTVNITTVFLLLSFAHAKSLLVLGNVAVHYSLGCKCSQCPCHPINKRI